MNDDKNLIIIKGGVARDSELTHIANGNALLKFSVATEEKWKGNDGEYKKKSTFHNCTVWGKLAEQYALLKKGDRVTVFGAQEHNSYEKDGVKKYFSSVKVDTISLEKPKGQPANNSIGDDPISSSPVKSDPAFTSEDIPW